MILLVWGISVRLILGGCLSKSLTDLLLKKMILRRTLSGNRYMLSDNIEKLFLGVAQAVLIFEPCSYLVSMIYFANALVSFNKVIDWIAELSETCFSLPRFIPMIWKVLHKFSQQTGFLNWWNLLQLSINFKIGEAYHIRQVRHQPVIQGNLVHRLRYIWVKC